MSDWVFLSNHGLALLCIARDPTMRLRDIADSVGITERAAHRLVSDLVQAGYVKRERHGNRNRYELRPEQPMRHSLTREHSIGEILAVLTGQSPAASAGRPGRPERRRGERRQQPSEPGPTAREH